MNESKEKDWIKEYDEARERENRAANIILYVVLSLLLATCLLFYSLACAGYGMLVCTG